MLKSNDKNLLVYPATKYISFSVRRFETIFVQEQERFPENFETTHYEILTSNRLNRDVLTNIWLLFCIINTAHLLATLPKQLAEQNYRLWVKTYN